MVTEALNAIMQIGASLIRGASFEEQATASGRFHAELIRNGEKIWEDDFPNTVTTEGKNTALDGFLAAGAVTPGPYMGLISSTSYSAIAAGDTAAQINGTNGWKEGGLANAPTYSGGRKSMSWSAASAGSKATSTACSFAITGTGTAKGAFIVFSTSASTTNDNTSGKLYSAGLFSAPGDRAVVSGDTLNVSYTASL